MKPADRKEVREAASTHRIGIALIDRILVAGRQSDRNARGTRRQAALDVLPQRVANPIQSPWLGWMDNRHRPQRLPHRPNLLEPGIASEIEGARQCHRRRRGKPCPHADFGSGGDARREFVLADRDSDMRGQAGIMRSHQQPDRVSGGEMIDGLHRCGKIDNPRPFQPRFRHPGRSPPNKRAPDRRCKREPA